MRTVSGDKDNNRYWALAAKPKNYASPITVKLFLKRC